MSTEQIALPTLHDHLAEPLSVGDPDVHGPLAVFPLFGPPPRLEYLPFAQAAALGVSIKELEGGASVNDLIVINPLDKPVLLYEGEEVLGAQQNRTFDVSVLVPAHSQLSVPVSCVEHGRWDHTRHGEAFTPAPQAAYPALRRMKNRAATVAAEAGLEARAVQSEVWAEIAQKSERMAAASPTGAMHDIYVQRRDRLHEFEGAISVHDGQIGAVAAIGGAVAVLDHVSRPDTFAALHGPLVHGYALDALEASTTEPPALDHVEAFVASVLTARVSQRDGIGLGRDVRFANGAALVAGDELVQLTAFGAHADEPAQRARIRRPSRRR